MKNFAVVWVILLMALARMAGAQVVTVEVRMDSEQFLPDEPLFAKVRVSNASGQTLRFGEAPDWLGFEIQTSDGKYVRALLPLDVTGAFDLASSETATKRVNLAPHYSLRELGNYKVVATVKVAKFGARYASPAKAFFITNGKTLKDLPFGVPGPAPENGEPAEPEIRKYLLVESLSGNESRLYVRVTDRADRNLKVVSLGKLISFSKPEPQLDRWNNLHVLFQTGARSFSYSVLSPEGFMIARQTHDYTESRPTMATSPEGRISIKGGSRRLTIDDVPPVDTASLPSPEPELAMPAEPAPATNAPPKKGKSPVNAKEKQKR